MAWLELLMRVVASCDKPGRGACILRTQDHLIGLPIIYLMLREEREPAELKHLSKRRKRKQYAMPLVTASENGIEQTEFPTVMWVKMWCSKIKSCYSSFDKLKLTGMSYRRGLKSRRHV
jgi:hypothetical protein